MATGGAEDGTWFRWIVTGLFGIGGLIVTLITGRTNSEIELLREEDEKKVNKDVFEQFEKRNDEQHAYTQNHLEKQEEVLSKIWEELKGKQDKE